MSFKDLFSKHSTDYAKFRPSYPDELFKFLSTISPTKNLAWDCAAGNGQASVKLSKYFNRVIATDASAQQISNALPDSKVEYRVATAENSGLESHSVDLITVAQAFHWFDHSKFFTEVKRVAKSNGVLALWCYGMGDFGEEVDAIVHTLSEVTLKNFWQKERKLVDEAYKNIPFPFEEVSHPQFTMQVSWTLQELIGYISTWSALKNYLEQKNPNPIPDVTLQLKKIWGSEAQRLCQWNVDLRIGRL